ncbi:hypothetical protein VN97_g8301 [Penicillium thymicola]|uniref:Uncharacterized protein n=1 Tax=Penicillium thymicola TaxID=293382 RepID=A0AAI9TDK5_PENTH|nr:hypothetical protein VN97_g8301 [Penicillium thymicola]
MTDSDSGDGNPTQQPQFLPTHPTNNNDQSNLPDEYDENDDDITQGDDLPKATPTEMMKIRELKHDTKSPRRWAILVECTLVPLCLEKTIDSSIPRPAKEHPKYTIWAFWSRVVAGWMYTQVDETPQERIQNMAHRPEYADDMMDKLMMMVQCSDNADSAINEIMKFDKLRRSTFNTAKEYITEYQRQYHVLVSFKVAPHPFHALTQLLKQLENEIPKVQFIMEEISNVEPKKITLGKMEQYCRKLQNPILL